MKIILSALLFLSLLFSSSLDSKIKQKKKQLIIKKNQYKKMDRELSSVAKKILTAKKEQSSLSKRLVSLEENIKNNEQKYLTLQKEEKVLSGSLRKINKVIGDKHDKFVALIAKNFSMSLALEELNQPTKKSVMMQEVYEVYAKNNNQSIKRLNRDISGLERKKFRLKEKKFTLKEEIDIYRNERLEYQIKKKDKDKIIVNLARDKAIYKKRFNKIKASRRSLERKLAKLKIIKRDKQDALRAKKREEQNQRELAQAVRENSKKRRVVNEPVFTSSSRVSAYSGGKTISPLKGARLIKKFGSYIDPIYKFKIFNKSITLKAPYAGSKVRSILKGKVVFAENSGGMLGKVVIVEHANGIHTIYAKLSRLAPGIYVGKELARASTIGKVEKSLMFEVTKNNKHMNPLKLIRL
jgi:septal ring factor EnvC (AmiA/AmiB activator)